MLAQVRLETQRGARHVLAAKQTSAAEGGQGEGVRDAESQRLA